MIGVYKITNVVNGKIYIGSSLNVKRRISDHKYLLKKNVHSNIKLQNSWNKYGSENFEFEILEECTGQNYLEREQYYMDMFLKSDEFIKNGNKYFINNGYNILPISQKGFNGEKSRESVIKSLVSTGRFNRVYQVDIDGNILGKYDMKKECPDSRHVVSKSIETGNTTISKKYGYIYENNYVEGWKPNVFKNGMCGVKNTWTKGKEVYVYDVYGRFVSKFDTVALTAKFVNKDVSFVSARLNKEPKKINSPYKFYTFPINTEVSMICFKSEVDDIKVFDIFDDFLGYTNVKDFSEKVKCNPVSVGNCLNGSRKLLKGYKLMRNDIV